MLKNYFKTAYRLLLNSKSYTILNSFGLTLGLVCSMLILLFVYEEYNVNRQFSDAESIYRINTKWHESGSVRPLSMAPLANVLPQAFPGIEEATRYTAIDITLEANRELYRESLVISSPSLFEFFTFSFHSGNLENALQNPYSVVLTESMAKKFFGETNAIDRTLNINTWGGEGTREFTVTGVIEDPGFNSITNFNGEEYGIFISFLNSKDFYTDANFDDWGNYNCLTYVKLRKDYSAADISSGLPALLQQNLPEHLREKVSLELEGLTDIYFNESSGAARKLSTLLTLLAVLILSLAIINYVNLSTARAARRSKEIGVRKVIGARRGQLFGQYIGESLMITIFSVVISLCLVWIMQDHFSTFVGRKITVNLFNPVFALGIISTTVITAISAGFYPALILSRLDPVSALKNKIRSSNSNFMLRRVLVVLQFTVAIALFASVLIISHQVEFMTTNNPGFQKEQVVVISSLPREWNEEGVEKLDLVKSEIEQLPVVTSTTIGWGPPGRYTGISADFTPVGEASVSSVNLPVSQVDANYLDVLKIELLEGRFFRKGSEENLLVVVINESAAAAFGWESVDGKQLKLGNNTFQVIGMVSDYHVSSFHEAIPPLVLADIRQWPLYRDMSIRLTPGNVGEHLNAIRAAWEKIYPGQVFDYYFLDRFWDSQYKREEKISQIAWLGTVLAILIAGMGLLGLVSINIVYRAKEIGVRKVLGAKVVQIIGLLTWDFIKPVVIGVVIAVPVTWVVMSHWLQEFTYHIDLSPFVFIPAVIGVLIVAISSVGWHSLKAATTNPVESLRNE